jgi:hypothetical protein
LRWSTRKLVNADGYVESEKERRRERERERERETYRVLSAVAIISGDFIFVEFQLDANAPRKVA